jgi:hypothetical protein
MDALAFWLLQIFYLLRKYARMAGGLACLAPGGPGRGVAVRERRGQGAEHRFGNPHGSAGWPCPGTTSGYRRDGSGALRAGRRSS